MAVSGTFARVLTKIEYQEAYLSMPLKSNY